MAGQQDLLQPDLLPAAVVAFHEAFVADGLESPFAEWLESWEDNPREERTITTRIECSDYFEQPRPGAAAHPTQVDPDGGFFRAPREMQTRLWPTEDFELAKSQRRRSTLPEDDLFAGIRERVNA